MPVCIDHAVSSGTFSLDGETFDVNNIWVVGDDTECIVIDAPHSVDDILAVVGDRRVWAIVCTHAHDDHVRVAPALRERANGGRARRSCCTPTTDHCGSSRTRTRTGTAGCTTVSRSSWVTLCSR